MKLLLIFLLLVAPGWADALTDLLHSRYAADKITSLKRAGDWALATIEYQMEGGGMALARRFPDSGWQIVTAGGGAMGPHEFFQVGVPRSLWRQLSPYPWQAPPDLGREPEWTWLTSKKSMTDEDVEGYTPWQLTLMVNEIYAAKGRPFKDPELREYFRQRSWYRERPDYSDALLTPLEKRNAEFIRRRLQR